MTTVQRVAQIFGLVAPTTFGLIPIGSHDVWLHVVLGAALLFFGLTARDADRVPSRV